MRALIVLVAMAWIGCASPSPPASPAATTGEPTVEPTVDSTSAEPGAAPKAAPAAVEQPAADVVDLTRGKRIETHGVRIMLRGTRTAHQPDSSEVMHAELEVKSGDDERTIDLARADGREPEFVDAFDLAFALDSVDASAKPSTARILVRKADPPGD